MRDQARREAGEDLRMDGPLQPAFLQVIVVIEADAQDLGRHGHRRQEPDGVEVDRGRPREVRADAQQVRVARDQFGQRAREQRVAPREAMPAGARVYRNSGDTTCLEVNDAHGSPAVRATVVAPQISIDGASLLVASRRRHPPDGLPATKGDSGPREAIAGSRAASPIGGMPPRHCSDAHCLVLPAVRSAVRAHEVSA